VPSPDYENIHCRSRGQENVLDVHVASVSDLTAMTIIPCTRGKGERAAAAKARLVSVGAALCYETLTVVDVLG
jgi:hypothetical protein